MTYELRIMNIETSRKCRKCSNTDYFLNAMIRVGEEDDDKGKRSISFCIECTTPRCNSFNEGSFYDYNELKDLIGDDITKVDKFIQYVETCSDDELKNLLGVDYDMADEEFTTMEFKVKGPKDQLRNLAVLLTKINDVSQMGVNEDFIVSCRKGLRISLDSSQKERLLSRYGERHYIVGFEFENGIRNVLYNYIKDEETYEARTVLGKISL